MKSVRYFGFGWVVAYSLACGWVLAGAQATQKVREPATTARAQGMRWRTGEQLDYQISWSRFSTAATAQLNAMSLGPFFGSPAWHFRATASSVNPLRYILTFDDQFDSYADAATLASRQYEVYLHEQGKQATHIVRMTSGREPRWAEGPMTIVLPGTRDPLAAAYFLRTVDWWQTGEASCPVYDGSKLYELQARLEEANVRVTVAAGSYDAWQIGVRVIGRSRPASTLALTVWIAHDAGHTPVLAEGDLPIGSVRLELARPPQ